MIVEEEGDAEEAGTDTADSLLCYVFFWLQNKIVILIGNYNARTVFTYTR